MPKSKHRFEQNYGNAIVRGNTDSRTISVEFCTQLRKSKWERGFAVLALGDSKTTTRMFTISPLIIAAIGIELLA